MVTLFIDSADRARVAPMLATGLFGGVTTNPAILDKASLHSADIPDFVHWAKDAGAKKVFVQSWGSDVAEFVDRGRAFRELTPDLVVKLPGSREGVEAAHILSADGPVLVTALHRASQILPVIASGATYAAPFVSRITAAGKDGMTEVAAMQRAIDGSGAALQLLAGSLRTPDQILELAALGVANVTLGPDVWDLFWDDEATAAAVDNFFQLASA